MGARARPNSGASRLTNDEYRNTLQDLLKLSAPPSDPLMPDPPTLGYDNFPSSISSTRGSQYAAMATRLAAEANVTVVAPCASRKHGIDLRKRVY